MGSPRLLFLVTLAACSPRPAAKPSVDVAVTTVDAGPVANVAPVLPPSVFEVAPAKCAPNALCAIYPVFPQILGMHVEGGRVCLVGADRRGCRGPDGWEFEPSAVIEKEAKTEGTLERSPQDIWKWTSHEASHFDGKRWEKVEMSAMCFHPNFASSVVTPTRFWFTQCEQTGDSMEEMSRRVLDVDPATNTVHRQTFEHAITLVAMPNGDILATGFDDFNSPLRRRRYRADGTEISNELAPGTQVPRVSFPDGVLFATEPRYFEKVERFDGHAWKTITKLPYSGGGFYAPSSRELWVGGLELFRWEEGKGSTKVTFRSQRGFFVEAIGGSGPNDVWVASNREPEEDPSVTLSHWDGKSWTKHDFPEAERDVQSIVAVSEKEAWLLSREHLYRWDGAAWMVANDITLRSGYLITLTPGNLWISGNSTIYRRSR